MVRRVLWALGLLGVTVVACARESGDGELRAASATSTTERATTSTTEPPTTTTTTTAPTHLDDAIGAAGRHHLDHPSALPAGDRGAPGAALRGDDQDGDRARTSTPPGGRVARCPSSSSVRSTSATSATTVRCTQGRLIVAANLANGMVEVFRDLYNARYPIERMEPIDVYGGDDMRSMRANNTSAFNCRAVTGGTGWSEHAYGRAIDVNPFVNPYVKGSTVLPPESAPYADRSRTDPGMIHSDDAVVRAFAKRGWSWGGSWSSLKDYQHFSTSGR